MLKQHPSLLDDESSRPLNTYSDSDLDMTEKQSTSNQKGT